MVGNGPQIALDQHLVGRYPGPVPDLHVPGPADPKEVVVHT